MSRPQSLQTEAILKACLEGHKVATVAKLLGLTRTNVYHVLQNHGIKLADLPKAVTVQAPITYQGEIRAGDKLRRIGMPVGPIDGFFIWGLNEPESIELRSYQFSEGARNEPKRLVLTIDHLRRHYQMQIANPVGTLLIPKMKEKAVS